MRNVAPAKSLSQIRSLSALSLIGLLTDRAPGKTKGLPALQDGRVQDLQLDRDRHITSARSMEAADDPAAEGAVHEKQTVHERALGKALASYVWWPPSLRAVIGLCFPQSASRNKRLLTSAAEGVQSSIGRQRHVPVVPTLDQRLALTATTSLGLP